MQESSLRDARLSSKYGSAFSDTLPASCFFKYSVSFKVAFRVKIFLKKYTLKIYLGKLGKNGDFTILNKLLEPYRSSYQRRSVKKMFLREGYTVKFFFQSISFVLTA